jgi:hypothetical protein
MQNAFSFLSCLPDLEYHLYVGFTWEYGNMSAVNLINEDDNESDIASRAASVFRDCFIAAAQSGTVLYVENDNLVSKAPNGVPIVIKRLCGRNPDLAQRLEGCRTFKIKKRKVNMN